jgi:hypothetical protein
LTSHIAAQERLAALETEAAALQAANSTLAAQLQQAHQQLSNASAGSAAALPQPPLPLLSLPQSPPVSVMPGASGPSVNPSPTVAALRVKVCRANWDGARSSMLLDATSFRQESKV